MPKIHSMPFNVNNTKGPRYSFALTLITQKWAHWDEVIMGCIYGLDMLHTTTKGLPPPPSISSIR